MSESNQEGYQTLGWIVNKSEQGLYLAVADEGVQEEIVKVYRLGTVEIYDYKRHPGAYTFRELQKWVTGLPETKVFMIANFQLAIQDEDSLKRLNFSRDMIDGLGKSFIFLVTPYGDDRLAVGACDFYAFVKLRVIFHKYRYEKEERLPLGAEGSVEESREEPAGLKQRLAEAYNLAEQAKDESDKGHYHESEKLLLRAREIMERLLGTEHLETARLQNNLAYVYKSQGRYNEAQELYEKNLEIRKKVLGEEHPSTAVSYNNLAGVYASRGKYREAEELFEKSLGINKKVRGEKHTDTASGYNNLAWVYEVQGKYREAQELYEKSLEIRKKVQGEEHPDTARVYNNLAGVYESQGKYREAQELYEKSLEISKKVLGEEHPDTALSYNNLAYVYA